MWIMIEKKKYDTEMNFDKEDIYFKVTDFTPQTKLKELKNFTFEK